MRWRTAFSLLLLALVRARAWSQDGCRADPYSDSACPAYTRLVRGRDCLVYRAAEWGLGSQLVHLLHAVKNVGADRLYFDFSASPYKW